jgi:hypothetical protein
VSWNKKLAKIWLNYVPPSRPSNSELCIYTKYLRDVQKSLNRKAELLVLGSTVEFRDWGYEQNLNVTVIDYSIDYYRESSLGARHRNLKEQLVNKKWQEMDFKNKFDVIIGDLVIGNLKSHEVPNFLERVSQSITENGLFMTKSLFKNEKKPKSIEELLKNYYTNYNHHHPFSKMMYDLNLACMDHQNELLDFQVMWGHLYDAFRGGILKKETMDVFSKLGWKDNMKFQFYIPNFEIWEHMVKKYFKGFKKEYGDDVYSQDIPVYVMYNKDRTSLIFT